MVVVDMHMSVDSRVDVASFECHHNNSNVLYMNLSRFSTFVRYTHRLICAHSNMHSKAPEVTPKNALYRLFISIHWKGIVALVV